MFLKKINSLSRKINFKMTLWHLGLLILSSCVLFIIFYFLFSQSLKKYDQDILEAKYLEYNVILQREGLQSLDRYLDSNMQARVSSNFFIRLADTNNKTFFFHASHKPNLFDIKEIESRLNHLYENQRWYHLKPKNMDHDIEVLSLKMDNGSYFQIGKTVVDRDILIKRFVTNFAEVLFFALLLGGIGGMVLSNRILIPLRNLIGTIKAIQTGHDEARVPLLNTNDELEELTLLFNGMLDRINTSNQGIRQTLDTIAHELRTPLTSIRGLAEVTLNKKITTESDYRRVLEDCIEGIDEILVEFKMMTDITEVESGLQNLHKEKVDLCAVCHDIIDLYEIIAEHKEIKIVLNSSPNIFVIADRKKIRQAVANLLDNAIKYSPHNTIIQIIITHENNNSVIKIKDQGIGISKNELPDIWKRLYRGENSRNEKGIGLGLSLVKSIIEAHKGEVSVEINNGPGSTFIITLPSLL